MILSELPENLLFRGLSESEIADAINLLSAREKRYKKGEIILHSGSKTSIMGLVLEGSVTVESNDMWGIRTILSHVGRGQFFAETYALLSDEPLLVDVTANEDCLVLFLRVDALFAAGRELSVRLLSNLLMISSHKNLHLSQRSFHTAPKSIRDRVLSYLNSVSIQTGHREFDIPFDRQQLADYLNVERTALSKELGKMRKDGYFTVKKNHFVILKPHMTE